MEPVYRGIEITAAAAARVLGTRITYQGMENIPAHGGAVVAMNHISYIDYLPAGLATRQRRRRIRYMLKAEMLEVRSVDWIIRHTRCIPVDRSATARGLRRGGSRAAGRGARRVFPEATISRNFELKVQERRGADGAGGAGSDRPADHLGLPGCGPRTIRRLWAATRFPGSCARVARWRRQGTVADLDAALRAEMTHHPARGAGAVPSRRCLLGPASAGAVRRVRREARQMEAAERAERARRAAERH